MFNKNLVPFGVFRSDEAATAKLKELAERLKRGEEVNISNTGGLINPNDSLVENGKTLKAPEGKLADHRCSCCSGSGMMTCPRCGGYGTFDDGSKCYYCQGARVVKCNACDGKGIIAD